MQKLSTAHVLALEPFSALSQKLILWRSHHDLPLTTGRRKISVFDFVKGLRFSAELIYITRSILSPHGLEVDWGQVISDDGTELSPECDVIIHKPGCHSRWNGARSNRIMDFVFIQKSAVIKVISCKSLIRSISKEHRDYCTRVTPYAGTGNLWLFVECVPASRRTKIIVDARNAGYDKAWYLYGLGKSGSECIQDTTLWLDFWKEIDKLGQ